jgi:hypothetical protein
MFSSLPQMAGYSNQDGSSWISLRLGFAECYVFEKVNEQWSPYCEQGTLEVLDNRI